MTRQIFIKDNNFIQTILSSKIWNNKKTSKIFFVTFIDFLLLREEGKIFYNWKKQKTNSNRPDVESWVGASVTG